MEQTSGRSRNNAARLVRLVSCRKSNRKPHWFILLVGYSSNNNKL